MMNHEDELSDFDTVLYIYVLEVFNFNHTKLKNILSSVHGINCRKH